ncbi:MAG: arylsulfatase [Verrucomicrobia bacterium]|nr:arylsulfatase [Verrucomicrobiota bacterium]MDA1068112.1 arylsulfatase [Verrucomicrobiota bacterium]
MQQSAWSSNKPFLVIFSVFILGLFQACSKPDGSARRSKPNIIFIMADDMGYGDLGSFGQEVIQTPYLDQMAKEGLRFTQVYAGSPVCAPSRSVLMTGLHTGHTTVRGNFGKFGVVGLAGGEGRVPLFAEDITVAEVLKEAGYVTGMSGKWGLGEPGTSGEPNDQGWDEWFGYLNQRMAHSYFPEFLWKNKERIDYPNNLEGKKGTYSHDLFTDFALEFVQRHKDEPFFLYLPFTVPHSRYEIPDTAPYTDRPWSDDEKVHAAMITRLDRDMGRLFESLKDLNIDQETIVFFCSDNGAAERWEGRFDSSGKLRGRKRDVYEGGIRTPMIVRWPGRVVAGETNDFPWYFADVLPTLADLAGATSPAGLDGVSVVPSILGKPQSNDRFLYWEFFESGFQQAVRWKDWKVVRMAPGLPIELYDLSKDESETRNIATQYPELVAKFETYLASARTESENWPVGE